MSQKFSLQLKRAIGSSVLLVSLCGAVGMMIAATEASAEELTNAQFLAFKNDLRSNAFTEVSFYQIRIPPESPIYRPIPESALRMEQNRCALNNASDLPHLIDILLGIKFLPTVKRGGDKLTLIVLRRASGDSTEIQLTARYTDNIVGGTIDGRSGAFDGDIVNRIAGFAEVNCITKR